MHDPPEAYGVLIEQVGCRGLEMKIAFSSSCLVVVLSCRAASRKQQRSKIIPAAKAIAEEHVEDLLGVEAVAPEALSGGAAALAADARPLLVAIPVIGCPVVGVAKTAEGLGDSCKATQEPSTAEHANLQQLQLQQQQSSQAAASNLRTLEVACNTQGTSSSFRAIQAARRQKYLFDKDQSLEHRRQCF